MRFTFKSSELVWLLYLFAGIGSGIFQCLEIEAIAIASCVGSEYLSRLSLSQEPLPIHFFFKYLKSSKTTLAKTNLMSCEVLK